MKCETEINHSLIRSDRIVTTIIIHNRAKRVGVACIVTWHSTIKSTEIRISTVLHFSIAAIQCHATKKSRGKKAATVKKQRTKSFGIIFSASGIVREPLAATGRYTAWIHFSEDAEGENHCRRRVSKLQHRHTGTDSWAPETSPEKSPKEVPCEGLLSGSLLPSLPVLLPLDRPFDRGVVWEKERERKLRGPLVSLSCSTPERSTITLPLVFPQRAHLVQILGKNRRQDSVHEHLDFSSLSFPSFWALCLCLCLCLVFSLF